MLEILGRRRKPLGSVTRHLYPGNALTEDYPHAGIKRAIVRGPAKWTEKPVWVKSRHPLVETVCSMGLVHLVYPKMVLHLVDKIDKRVSVRNVREGFNGGDDLVSELIESPATEIPSGPSRRRQTPVGTPEVHMS